MMNKQSRSSSQLWRILANAIRNTRKEERLLDTLQCLEQKCSGLDSLVMKVFEIRLLGQTTEDSNENVLWLELLPSPVIQGSNNHSELPTVISSLHIRVYKTLSDSKVTDSSRLNSLLDVLTGFDNTGNVHLWPSEILLTHSMFFENLYPGLWNELHQNFEDHPIQTVCELCAGMTGAAGIAVSLRKWSNIFKTSYVLITDGNDRCVASIISVVDHHKKRFLNNSNATESFISRINLDAKTIRWPKNCPESSSVAQLDQSLIHHFDLIVAADCFFDQTYHISMLDTIDKLLSMRSGSTFLAIAPLRGNSLNNYINLAYQTENICNWSVKIKPPSDYLCPQFISYLINESNRDYFTDNELDKYIGHLIMLTRN
ncbi:unnamed protein product [Heterobilharzia americana]|nr:unnamed protein product [Heterobilharzia americana]